MKGYDIDNSKCVGRYGMVLDVYVLKTPNSERSNELLNLLSTSAKINLTILNSTMIAKHSSIQIERILVDLKYSSYFIGRPMLLAEIGCSFTHNTARRAVSSRIRGGVILEDDAEILNLDELIRVSNDFLTSNLGKKAVLTLYRSTELNSKLKNNSRGYHRILGTPKLAVAYVLTTEAAAELFYSNTPIRFVADWPVSHCIFFQINKGIVNHNDDSQSTIVVDSQSIRSLHYSRLLYITKIIRQGDFKSSDIILLLRIFPKIVKNFFKFKIDLRL